MDNEPIQYRFTDIQIQSKGMNPLPENVTVDSNFLHEVKVNTVVQPANEFVIVQVGVIIKTNENVPIAFINTAFVFQVPNFEKYILKTGENLYNVPNILEDTFRQVSISTTRGILFSELKGTYLHRAILPVVFLNQFKEDTSDQNPFVTTEQQLNDKENK